MKKTLKMLSVLVVSFIILSQQANAQSWPPEVKPEQGHAAGSITLKCQPSYTTELVSEDVNIATDFWNVGKLGTGQDYSGMPFTMTSTANPKRRCIVGGNFTFNFAGGPNGIITTGGPDFPIHLRMVNGSNIELTYNQNFEYSVPTGVGSFNKTARYSNTVVVSLPIQNPEVFSKYRWSMDQEPPIPKIGGDKYSIETIGGARFNDLYGQVEVNIPNSDGTYDDEAWDFAKIDMELPPGTRIKVAEKSGLLLTMPNTQTDIIVGPETEIVLVDVTKEKMSMEGSPWGKLKANVKRMFKDGSLEIEMSQAVAGIKGTVFSLEDTKDKSTINVMEGSVEFKSKATGKTEMVNAGETLSSDANGFGQKMTFDINAENAKWDELTMEMKKSTTTEKTNTDYKKYLYYVGIAVLLVAIAFVVLLIKKNNKKSAVV